jgi:hypothetical protein
LSIVYQQDKRSGISYTYKSKSNRDKKKKRSRSKTGLMGRITGLETEVARLEAEIETRWASNADQGYLDTPFEATSRIKRTCLPHVGTSFFAFTLSSIDCCKVFTRDLSHIGRLCSRDNSCWEGLQAIRYESRLTRE